MRRRLPPLLLLGLVGLAGVSGAVSASSGAPPPAWDVAIEVPGTAAVNHGNASVSSVSCATAGNCAAGGSYTDRRQHDQALVVDKANGSWGNAIKVPGTGTLNRGGSASVNSVSCASAGNCAAGGVYTDGSRHLQAFVVDETNGNWGNAIEVPGTATLNHGDAHVSSVSCATAGNCAAGGHYTDSSGRYQVFVVDETNGSWGNAIEVPGTASLKTTYSEVSSIACATHGNCAAGGTYYGAQGFQAFVVDETHGHWGTAIDVPGTATLNNTFSEVSSISCATAGNCAAGGTYTNGSGDHQGFIAEETNGNWGNAMEVPGMATLNSSGPAQVASVSCATAGNCAAGGYYTDSSSHQQAFVVGETNGSWGDAMQVRGTSTLKNGDSDAWVNSISCATAGNCTAGGAYWRAGVGQAAFLANETNGTWNTAFVVPGTPSLDRHGPLRSPSVRSISCAAAANCAAGGSYRNGSRHLQAFVVNATPPLSLDADQTTCNGAYAGTGAQVIVPTGATCTLIPGTRVTGDVTVSKGGILYATSVKIVGGLTIAGSATVCESKVLADVTAVSPGGSIELGGRSCVRSNTFLSDVLVQNDKHDVTIRGNKIAGDLTVLNSHGTTDSISDNAVGNLLVAHSGPVVVTHNHANGTIRCIANNPQHGRGNKARGKNTCPR